MQGSYDCREAGRRAKRAIILFLLNSLWPKRESCANRVKHERFGTAILAGGNVKMGNEELVAPADAEDPEAI